MPPNKKASRNKKNKRRNNRTHSTPEGNDNAAPSFRNYPSPVDIDNFIDKLNSDGEVSADLKKFFIYVMERQAYGPHMADEYVYFVLSSYFTLKSNYRYISRRYELPPRGFLEDETVKDLTFWPGVRDVVLELIKIKIENCKPDSKICVLNIDEASLTPEISHWDKYGVIGYDDNGKSRGNLPARFVTTIGIHSIDVKWTIPFAYYFTSETCSADALKEYLFEAIMKLDEIGLEVLGVVTKLKMNIHKLAKSLNISVTNQTFKVGNKNVVFLYDIPQLMNITRNNLMKYKFKFEGKKASWKYITKFFVKEITGADNCRLTSSHMNPNDTERIIPRFSIEVLNSYVAAEMMDCISSGKLSKSATGTAECIDWFGKLFLMMHSISPTSRHVYAGAYKGTEQQVKFLDRMINFLENLRIYDESEQDRTEQVIFIKAWLITIKSMMNLWDVLSLRKYKFLLTGNINCELADTSMGVLRYQILDKDPTPCRYLEYFGQGFEAAYFKDWQIDDSEKSDEFDVENEYTKKIFNRIPNTLHDLTGKTKMNNGFIPKKKDHTVYFTQMMQKWLDVADVVSFLDSE